MTDQQTPATPEIDLDAEWSQLQVEAAGPDPDAMAREAECQRRFGSHTYDPNSGPGSDECWGPKS